MAFLSDVARARKLAYFLRGVSADSRILEIGCGDCWLRDRLRASGWTRCAGLDLRAPADIVGDVLNWRTLGIAPASFDVVIAFEVVEHVDCFQEMYDILKPGGLLFLTSPAPEMDWLCKIFEWMHLTQRRTSPHSHLVRFEEIGLFERVSIKRVGLAAQWGIFRKPGV